MLSLFDLEIIFKDEGWRVSHLAAAVEVKHPVDVVQMCHNRKQEHNNWKRNGPFSSLPSPPTPPLGISVDYYCCVTCVFTCCVNLSVVTAKLLR